MMYEDEFENDGFDRIPRDGCGTNHWSTYARDLESKRRQDAYYAELYEQARAKARSKRKVYISAADKAFLKDMKILW